MAEGGRARHVDIQGEDREWASWFKTEADNKREGILMHSTT
jgi:hypothetical protein